MGLLRFILAIAVVVYHSYKVFGLRMCGGQVAVESFYMISGFYMALILNEKYIGLKNYKKFILSRFLRIYPVYWIILAFAILLSVIGYLGFNQPYYLARYISYYQCLPWYTMLYFIIENIIVLGQDVLYFTKLNDVCDLQFVYNPLSFKHNGYNYLFVPQAWTVSLEFCFYLIAPFLVTKSTKWQLLVVVIAFAIRYYCVKYFYLSFDPWTYRFFIFELGFFMLGSLAYLAYKYINTKQTIKYLGQCLAVVVILIIVFYEEITLSNHLKNNLLFGFIGISLPFIFNAFKNNKWDRFIGELSFSIYISHHLIVSLFRGYFFSHTNYIQYYGYAVVLTSIAFSVIVYLLVIKPIERFRQKKVEYL